MKLNSGKYRITIKFSTFNMLYFIHINKRILDRADEKYHKFTRFYAELTDEQAVNMKDDLEAIKYAKLINSLTKGLERQVIKNINIKAAGHIARARVHFNALFFLAIHTFFIVFTVT
jgi:hypothetical protein